MTRHIFDRATAQSDGPLLRKLTQARRRLGHTPLHPAVATLHRQPRVASHKAQGRLAKYIGIDSGKQV